MLSLEVDDLIWDEALFDPEDLVGYVARQRDLDEEVFKIPSLLSL